MLQAERRVAILRAVGERNSVTVAQLCEELHVSDMTIRRDLREMEMQGLLRRVHGGAMKIIRHSNEPPFILRQTQLHEAKQQIGRKAAELIANSDIIALDSGTTTLEIARALDGQRELTIITGGLPIINELVSRYSLVSDIRLIVSGGIVRPREMSMIGHHPARLYAELHVDKAFIAAGGISLEHGLTTYNLDEALVTRTMIATADQVIVVADASKFNRVTFASIAPLSEVDVIITDHNVDKRTTHRLQDMGIEVIIADAE
jgi:DeoR/GlpR family transcriptional regulator of sugar metabolism